MSQGLIPQRYARALYKYAKEKGNTSSVYEEMKQVVSSFRGNALLQKTLSNPFVSDSDKERLLRAAAGKTAEDDFSRFVRLVLEHRREDYFYLMALDFCAIYREENNIKDVKITTAVKFDDKEMQKLRDVVERAFKDSTLEYNYAIDADLIGGFVIDVDTVRMDASISNELEQLRQSLLKS